MQLRGQASDFHFNLSPHSCVLALSGGSGEEGVWRNVSDPVLRLQANSLPKPCTPLIYSCMACGFLEGPASRLSLEECLGHLVDPPLLYQKAEPYWVSQFHQCREIGNVLLRAVVVVL